MTETNNSVDQISFNFKTLGIPIPDSVLRLSLEKQELIYNYLKQMKSHEKKTYIIAFHHLGTSFNVYKSNGFKEWDKERK
jgi:hypothetical protein